jgi:hypothetical protein
MWWDHGDSISNCVFEKKTARFSILEENGFTNDIDGGAPFWPIEIYNDSSLVSYIDAYKLISYFQRQNLQDSLRSIINACKLSITSNPVLVILHKID